MGGCADPISVDEQAFEICGDLLAGLKFTEHPNPTPRQTKSCMA
jgi:hypothetical protein